MASSVRADPRLADPTFLRLMGLRRKKRLARASQGPQRPLPQTDDELWQYVHDTWDVRIPRVQVCASHVAPFRVFADAFFARQSMIVLKASRGLGGKSFLLSVLGATKAALTAADVVILGGAMPQSQNVHRYMAALWDRPSAPRHLLREPPLATETRFAAGHLIKAIPASQSSVRGLHPQLLLLDECDVMDLAIFDAAMGQTLAKPGIPACTVASSTHQVPDGTFTEVIRRAKEKGWFFAEYCYRETMQPHGWLDPAEVDRKRQEMTAAQWEAEVEGQEPSPESRAIMPQAVGAMFRTDLGRYHGAVGEYIEAEPPVEGATYAHGADWAKAQDFTEIVTLRTDTRPMRLVAYERLQRLPWPVMVARLDARRRRYGGESLHDKTGLGDVVDGYLEEAADGFLLVGKARSDLFSEWVNAIENGQVVSPYIESLEAQYRYCRVEDLYGSGHPPDGFVAGALAYRKALSAPPLVGPISLTRVSPWRT